jgi:tetratricopeptide (TPR) repeat protein
MKTILKSAAVSLLLLIFAASHACSQNYEALQNAFSESYTYEYAGDYSKAAEALKKVYDASSYETNLRLGWLTYMSGLFNESIAYYQKAIALMPYAIEPRLGIVNPASAMGNWDQVKAQYAEILKTDPNNTLVNYRMGLIAYGKSDYASAFKYFEKVINLYPFDYDSMIMFAWTNYKLGKLREAKVLFNKVLLMKPKDSSALEGLGLIK